MAVKKRTQARRKTPAIRFTLRELRESYTNPDRAHYWKTGISLRALADEGVGLGYAALSQLESGKRKSIRFDTLAKLCVFFDVEVQDVLQLDDGRKRKTKEETRGGGAGPTVTWTPQQLENARQTLAQMIAANALLPLRERKSHRAIWNEEVAPLVRMTIGYTHLLRLLKQYPARQS
jgi:DNA-binding Xre family transcriptional regulator